MSLYVAPMRERGDDNVERCEPHEAQLWALYRRYEDGTSQWISDHDTEAEARAAMDRAA